MKLHFDSIAKEMFNVKSNADRRKRVDIKIVSYIRDN